MSAVRPEPLFCRDCDAVTAHTPLRHPRFECCQCGAIRTAGGCVLYGLPTTQERAS